MKEKAHDSFIPPRWILTLLGLCGIFWLVSELREIVVLIIVGYSVAFILDPWLDVLERRKIRRSNGFFILMVVAVLLAVGFFLIGIPPLAEEFHRVTTALPEMVGVANHKVLLALEWLSAKSGVDLSVDMVREKLSSLPQIGADTVQKVISGVVGFLLQGYSLTLTLVNLLLLPFIVYYLAVDLDRFHEWVSSIIPSQSKKQWRKIFSEINLYVRAFVSGQFTVALILFFLYAIGFWFVGFKQWLFLASIAGLGNIIPYVGSISGFVLATLLSLVGFGEVSHLLWTWGVFGVVQFLEGTLITPRIVGEKVGLSPLLVILALFAGGKLFGLLGIFLAVPAAACIRVLASHGYRTVLKG